MPDFDFGPIDIHKLPKNGLKLNPCSRTVPVIIQRITQLPGAFEDGHTREYCFVDPALLITAGIINGEFCWGEATRNVQFPQVILWSQN
jgi:hypothetical protein